MHEQLDARPHVADERHPAGQPVRTLTVVGEDVHVFRTDGEGQRVAGPGLLRRRRHRELDLADPDRPAVHARHADEVAAADEVGDEGVGGVAVDIERRTRLLHPGRTHHHHEVRHRHRLALVVGDDDGGDAQLFLEHAQFHLHVFPELRIEGGEGLVEQEQPRFES